MGADTTSNGAGAAPAPPPLRLERVTKLFGIGPLLHRKRFAAVDGVSLAVNAGEAVGLVGESGCGKSTLARLVLMLDRPTSGNIYFRGAPYSSLGRERTKEFRSNVQAVFQDPYTSLNPARRVGSAVSESCRRFPRSERRERIERAMREVGLPDAVLLNRYPHQFSGGQKQRVAIARAIAPEPQLIVLDEPTSALDVSMRAQVLNLLLRLRRDYGSAFLFISHDILAVRHITDRIAVMYLGQIIEEGPSSDVVTAPLHPYTQMLISAMADETPLTGRDDDSAGRDLGEVPNPLQRPAGCRFHPRCPMAMARCRTDEPPTFDAGGGRSAACWLIEGAPSAEAVSNGGRQQVSG